MSSKESNGDDHALSSTAAGEVHTDAAEQTMNTDLDNIFDDDELHLTSLSNQEPELRTAATPMTVSSMDRRTKVRENEPLDLALTWQNEDNDRVFRKALIKDIAYLLKDRKLNPTEKWIKELPHKARKLEEQLYKSAPSLEAYLDKATLKHRLKKVAHAITSQFRLSKDGKTRNQLMLPRRDGAAAPTSNLALSLTSPAVNMNLSASNFASLTESGVDADMNQKILQEQILENIRQQQLIMKSLMMTQQQSQQRGASSNDTSMMDTHSAMMGAFGQGMHGEQGNSNLGSIENMLLLQQARQMGLTGSGDLNINAMGNSLSSQELAMMNNIGLGGHSGMGGSAGLGSGSGMQGMMGMNGMNSMNGIDPSQLYQNQAMLRNSFHNGSVNPVAMMGINQGNMGGNVIPGPSMSSMMNTGVHPTMPPPSFGASGRSSFSNGTGNGTPEDNLNLSPNSFNW